MLQKITSTMKYVQRITNTIINMKVNDDIRRTSQTGVNRVSEEN